MSGSYFLEQSWDRGLSERKLNNWNRVVITHWQSAHEPHPCTCVAQKQRLFLGRKKVALKSNHGHMRNQKFFLQIKELPLRFGRLASPAMMRFDPSV